LILIPTIVEKPTLHEYEVVKELMLVSFTTTQSNKFIILIFFAKPQKSARDPPMKRNPYFGNTVLNLQHMHFFLLDG